MCWILVALPEQLHQKCRHWDLKSDFFGVLLTEQLVILPLGNFFWSVFPSYQPALLRFLLEGTTHLGSVHTWSLTCFANKHWTCCLHSVHLYAAGQTPDIWFSGLIFSLLYRSTSFVFHLLLLKCTREIKWSYNSAGGSGKQGLPLLHCYFVHFFFSRGTDRVSSFYVGGFVSEIACKGFTGMEEKVNLCHDAQYTVCTVYCHYHLSFPVGDVNVGKSCNF